MSRYWKAGIAVLLVILAFCAGWYVNGLRWQEKAADALAEEHARRHEMLQGMVQRLNGSAEAYQQQKAASETEIAKLKQDLKNAQKNHPLPAGCQLDADRLRIVRKAVDAANRRAAP